MAAATPVLSTLTLIGLFAVTAPGRVSGRQGVLLLAAAFMISAAVALGRHRPERSGAPAETLTEPMASQPPQGAR